MLLESGEIRHGGLFWGWDKYGTYMRTHGIQSVGEAGDRNEDVERQHSCPLLARPAPVPSRVAGEACICGPIPPSEQLREGALSDSVC